MKLNNAPISTIIYTQQSLQNSLGAYITPHTRARAYAYARARARALAQTQTQCWPRAVSAAPRLDDGSRGRIVFILLSTGPESTVVFVGQ